MIPKFKKVKIASGNLILVKNKSINTFLRSFADKLNRDKSLILAANRIDLAKMDQADPKYDRLKLDAARIKAIAADVWKVAKLPSPLHLELEKHTLPNGLKLRKISVPLGVVGVIYESRPNVTVDVFALCFKSGNAVILKGGKEAENTNRALVKIIQKNLREHGLPSELITLLPSDREAVYELLNARGWVDVIIPRGGQGLINFVRENSKVPVIETGAGIVHSFFDESGKIEFGRDILFNAKTRRPSVCNSLDTLVMHQKRLHDLAKIVAPLAAKQVEIFADTQAFRALAKHYPEQLLHRATPESFGQEYLSLKMSIKTVKNLDEALEHIRTYSSKHSEAIISEKRSNIERFLNEVDAACVYANTSTAFSDGAQFGLGAEIGISTQKLHARGPMGLRELTSYKWIVEGKGQIRTN